MGRITDEHRPLGLPPLSVKALNWGAVDLLVALYVTQVREWRQSQRTVQSEPDGDLRGRCPAGLRWDVRSRGCSHRPRQSPKKQSSPSQNWVLGGSGSSIGARTDLALAAVLLTVFFTGRLVLHPRADRMSKARYSPIQKLLTNFSKKSLNVCREMS